jgi:hypothetical protein
MHIFLSEACWERVSPELCGTIHMLEEFLILLLHTYLVHNPRQTLKLNLGSKNDMNIFLALINGFLGYGIIEDYCIDNTGKGAKILI